MRDRLWRSALRWAMVRGGKLGVVRLTAMLEIATATEEVCVRPATLELLSVVQSVRRPSVSELRCRLGDSSTNPSRERLCHAVQNASVQPGMQADGQDDAFDSGVVSWQGMGLRGGEWYK
jgi:hypothetical protein